MEMGSATACACVFGGKWRMGGEERRWCWRDEEDRAYVRTSVFGGVGNVKKWRRV